MGIGIEDVEQHTSIEKAEERTYPKKSPYVKIQHLGLMGIMDWISNSNIFKELYNPSKPPYISFDQKRILLKGFEAELKIMFSYIGYDSKKITTNIDTKDLNIIFTRRRTLGLGPADESIEFSLTNFDVKNKHQLAREILDVLRDSRLVRYSNENKLQERIDSMEEITLKRREDIWVYSI